MNTDITLADIRGAAERIGGIAHRTPVLTSRTFDALTGIPAFFKCENFQRGGAFKIRGAANFVYSIPKDELSRGVVSFSSGNHAQAVAIAAASVGTPATIVMPADAPKSKLEATRGYGAKVVTYDRMLGSREAIGRKIAEETGATLIPPFDHPWIIAGQGTAALELLEEVPDLDSLIVCIGGGGLMSGSAHRGQSSAARHSNFWRGAHKTATIHIFHCGPDRASKSRCRSPSADGLRATKPGELTFPDHPKIRRRYRARQRQRDSRNDAIFSHPDEDAGGTERRGSRGRRATQQTAQGSRKDRRNGLRRECGPGVLPDCLGLNPP